MGRTGGQQIVQVELSQPGLAGGAELGGPGRARLLGRQPDVARVRAGVEVQQRRHLGFVRVTALYDRSSISYQVF
jgi:hypothetical protein